MTKLCSVKLPASAGLNVSTVPEIAPAAPARPAAIPNVSRRRAGP